MPASAQGNRNGTVALTPDPANGDPLLTSFATGQVLRLVHRTAVTR